MKARACAWMLVVVVAVAALGRAPVALAQASPRPINAIVLVNSASARYGDFASYLQPYLDTFGVPYTVIDVAGTAVPANIGDYPLIVIGHAALDVAGSALNSAEHTLISNAVAAGTGLVNFDGDLAGAGNAPRYAFVQSIFGFSYGGTSSPTQLQINSTPGGAAADASYVVALQNANASYTLDSAMTVRSINVGSNGSTLATAGGSPFLIAARSSAGRAVQWASMDWMRLSVWGPVRGLDDLVWRSLVWAARKPFAMQGMPPLVTLRVDDGTGPYWWVDAAAAYGIRVWNGYFLDDQNAQDIVDMRRLVQDGWMTVSAHARSQDLWFFYDRHRGNLPDATVAQYFADATAFHNNNNIPISNYVVPHFYEIGSNVFDQLRNWNVEFVGTILRPGDIYYGNQTLLAGPYFRTEVPCQYPCTAKPVYYADFMQIPGRPDLNGEFFAALTEIRDVGGYEWYPSNDVSGTVSRGVGQLRRAFDSMILPTFFTHEYYIQDITPANWNAILAGVTSGIASYQPEYVTMDQAMLYLRSVRTSNIAGGTYDTGSNTLTANLSGNTDVPTRFFVFTESSGQISSRYGYVPVFNGSTNVAVNLDGGTSPTPTPGPTNTPVPTNTPNPAATATPTPTNTPVGAPTNTPTATPAGQPIRIDVWQDANQAPALATTTDGGALVTNDNQWTEFLWPVRGYPGVFAAVGETPPVMRFASAVPNGTYQVRAGLYWNTNLRYYWGTSAATPEQYTVDVTSGTNGDFAEYALGTVTVTNGTFELFTRRADELPGGSGYPFYGWAWLQLVPQAGPAPTATATTAPTNTPAPTATSTAAPTATATPTNTPTAAPTNTPTATPTAAPTATPTPIVVGPSGFTHTATADFLPPCVVRTNTSVSDASGGEVRLASTLEDYFSGTTVDTTRWLTGTTYDWYTVPPTVTGGVLVLDAAYLRSQTNFQPYQPRFFEVRARQRINTSPAGWPDLGFYRALPPLAYGSTYPADSALRIFVSRDTNTTFVRGRDGNETQPLTDIEIPTLDLTQYHIFRIEWDAAGTRFYVDGALQATIPGVATLNTWAFIYHQTPTTYGSSPMHVDWARIGQYPSAGSFTSCPQDAGQLVTWSSATWDASTPSGTGMTVSTRTSVDGTTWSAWSALSGSNITSPAGRYLQYRLDLTSSQVLQSPEVRSITVAAVPYSAPSTATSTATPTNTPTATPTNTPAPTATATNTPAPTPTNTPAPTATPEPPIFANGFESGNLSAWTSSVTDGGDLSVTTAAALVGTRGMQAVIDDNNAIHVTDDTPNAEARYRARFYFDPNSIPMSNGNEHVIFYGYSGTTTAVVRIDLRRSSSQYQLRAGLLSDAGVWSFGAWTTITDARHWVELDWRASTASGANNGALTFWIDGTQITNLTGIDNDTRRIDRARLGAVTGIDSGTRGTYYFDDFVSRRTTLIGPAT